jgi:hypothetical protein
VRPLNRAEGNLDLPEVVEIVQFGEDAFVQIGYQNERKDLIIEISVRLICTQFKVAKVVRIRYFARGRDFEEG